MKRCSEKCSKFTGEHLYVAVGGEWKYMWGWRFFGLEMGSCYLTKGWAGVSKLIFQAECNPKNFGVSSNGLPCINFFEILISLC